MFEKCFLHNSKTQVKDRGIKMTATTEATVSIKKSSTGETILEIQKCHFDETPKEFTDIVGGSGAWQKWIILICIIGGFPLAWNHMSVAFLAYDYDYWCARPEGYNGTVKEWWAEAIPNETIKGVNQHSQCNIYDFNSSVDGNYSTIACNSFEFEEEDSLTIIREWGMVCDKEWMVSMSQSIYMAGFFAAVLLSGQLADIYGRHAIIILNIAVLLIAGIATTFSTSIIMFVVMRFFVAMGYSGLGLTQFVLGIEVVGSKRRALYGYITGFGWHLGYCTLPIMAYFIRSWRKLQLAITLPSLIFISFYWILPESPRWLIANCKLDKAIPIMEKAARINKVEVQNLEMQVQKLYCAAEKENEMKGQATVLDLLRTPNLRKKTLILYFTWVVIAFIYYGLSLNTADLGGDFYLNFFISGLVEIPATLSCIWVTRTFGTRRPFMCTLMLCGLACIATIFVPPYLHWLKVTTAMFGKFLVSASFSVVYIYSAEIFPTVARNVGVGSSSTMARIGSIVAPFMKELGKFTHPGVPMGLFGILSITSGCLIWFLPETTGFPIPETLQQAEDFGRKVPDPDHTKENESKF